MDCRLVVGKARSRRTQGVLHSAKSARRARGAKLRLLPAEHQNPAQGAQRRLAPMRAELLPPLSPGRAPCRAGRYVNKSRRVSLRYQKRERVMSDKKKNDKNRNVSRRKML